METFSEIGAGLDRGGEPYDEASTAAEPEAEEFQPVGSIDTVNLDIAVTADRKVIRNVSLQLAADDTRDTYDQIVTIAEANKGFVSAAEVSPRRRG